MDGQIVVGADKGVRQPGHGLQVFHQPGRLAVGEAVRLGDAQLGRKGQTAAGQRGAKPVEPLIKTVTMGMVPHKSQRAGPQGDQPVGHRNGTGGVFHRDKVAGHGRKVRPGIGVGKDHRQTQLADKVGVALVEHLNAEDARGVLQHKVGGQTAVPVLVRLDLVDHQRIARPAHAIGKAGDKVGAVMIPPRHAQGQQRDAAALRHRMPHRFRQLPVTHLPRLVQHLLARGLRHAAPTVEHLGHRIARQPAGIGNILHRDFLRGHLPSLQCGFSLL